MYVMIPSSEMRMMDVFYKQHKQYEEDQKSTDLVKEFENFIHHLSNLSIKYIPGF